MHHVISIGGGISSTWLLVDRVLAKYPADSVHAVICPVENEHPDVWKLCDAVSARYHIPIHRIGQSADIWQVFFEQRMMGNPFADPCSRILKREKMARYMSQYTPADTMLHVGITADEIDRMLAITRNWSKQGFKVQADLADEPLLNRDRLVEMCKQEFGFAPQLYLEGFSHNNCGGFCVKAGKGQMARLLYYHPDIYRYHERMEQTHQRFFCHDNTIMRDEWTRGGVRGADPLTLCDFRLRMQSKWANLLPGFDPFEGLDTMPGCKFCDAAA